MTDLRVELARHQINFCGGLPECGQCNAGWPCDASLALAALDAAEQERDEAKSQVAALREAIYAMDREIGTWLSDYAPGQTWLRALQVAYGMAGIVGGVPTSEDIAADADGPHPRVHPLHGCPELAARDAKLQADAVAEALSVERIAKAILATGHAESYRPGAMGRPGDSFWLAELLHAALQESDHE
jgi:hypothetical protein